MKNINDLSEQEILELSYDDIQNMVKFKMAEEGIKLITYPAKPIYYEVQKPSTKVYYCPLLGHKLSFTSLDELTKVLEVLAGCNTICSVDSNYELPDGSKYFIKPSIENANYSSDGGDSILSVTAFGRQEYVDIKGMMTENIKFKKAFDASVKEYETAVKESQWILDDITEKVDSVRNKYDTLNRYTYKFKNEYLPLADNKEDVAMKFLDKAYGLSEEQKEYVLSNYSK